MSLIAGYITNRLLTPGFTPYFSLSATRQAINVAGKLTLSSPAPIRNLCSIIVVCLCLYALWPGLKRWARKAQAALAVLAVLPY
jgi:hypothetical protein